MNPPSQRFRFEQYFNNLSEAGIQYEVSSFYHERSWRILYQKGKALAKLVGILGGLIRRLKDLFKVNAYDRVFIHREALPIGPPIMEFVLARVLSKKLVYDFDDAIWMKDDVAPTLLHFLKNPGKVSTICRWSHRVSCGNQFLANFARRYNDQVTINPTTIDENYHLPAVNQNQPLVVGWTGTHSTLVYLNELLPVLNQLYQEIPFRLLVICNREPEFDFPDLLYIPWSKQTEIQDLNKIDIGLMPLIDSSWAQGKCGFKILQYMALQKAALASPVGVNKSIIKHLENGMLCQTSDEWISALRRCLLDERFRVGLGQQGRNTVLEHYSVSNNSANFLSLFH